ncbi:MAG TPA: twin-arginine translocation signal domain-containing protein [Anaerolineae bacterium]|nr:twin-arginine translocation signal domain-containing protein [Anaerolineae bacterium]
MLPEALPPDEASTTSTEISRRKLLKMLTVAGAGASTVVLLSGQWVKPVAAGGQLAPHAQTSQPVTHQFVSGNAQQDPQNTANLLTSAIITPADPNIPIVATVSADIPAPAPTAPAVMTVLGSQTAMTDATGQASFTFPDLPINCQNVPSGSTTVSVQFTFANDPADGTGNLTVTTLWEFGC